MKVRLLKDQREGKKGETVEVSPERFAHFRSIEAAELVKDAGEQADEPKAAEEKAEAVKPAEKKKAEKPAKSQEKPAAKKTTKK